MCDIPNKGQKNGYGCFNTPVYKEAGVYEQDIPMTKFWQNDSNVPPTKAKTVPCVK